MCPDVNEEASGARKRFESDASVGSATEYTGVFASPKLLIEMDIDCPATR